jgi:hypothetical protein
MLAFKVISACALFVVSTATLPGCSSSSNPPATTDGGTKTCGSGGGGHSNAACDDCTQTKCSAQFNACFGGGGACSAFVAGGCQGMPDGGCTSCLMSMESCQKSSCSSACGSSGTDAGTDVGGTGLDAGKPTTANCVALDSCCEDPSLPADSKTGCHFIAGMNDDSQCQSTMKSFQDAGYCK